MRVRKVTAHRRAVAARGLRLHAAGPWAGGDGSAARQRLRLLLRPLRLSSRPPSMPSRAAATGM
jgi:hypothetical protein